MLVIAGISVAYGNIPVLRDVSLEVEPGEIVGVLGNNGAGKSTLLLTIAGILKPLEGDIRFKDESIVGQLPETIVRKRVSLVPENRHIFPQLTVEGNLRLGATTTRRSEPVESMLDGVMDHFPVLRRYASAPAGRLSGGEQQQLAIARALMAQPELLMLDEPSLGLAPVIIDDLFEILDQLRDHGTTVLLVEQNVVRALELVDRVYTLRSGEIEFSGTPTEVVQLDSFERRYLGIAG